MRIGYAISHISMCITMVLREALVAVNMPFLCTVLGNHGNMFFGLKTLSFSTGKVFQAKRFNEYYKNVGLLPRLEDQ